MLKFGVSGFLFERAVVEIMQESGNKNNMHFDGGGGIVDGCGRQTYKYWLGVRPRSITTRHTVELGVFYGRVE